MTSGIEPLLQPRLGLREVEVSHTQGGEPQAPGFLAQPLQPFGHGPIVGTDDATRTLILPDLAATQALAARLAPHLGGGLRVSLRGGLGAGKTTFVRSLLAALGHTGRVRSPTFTLHEPYEIAGLPVHHFDLYRFTDPREWIDAGFDELTRGSALSLIEWPELAQSMLPPMDLDLLLAPIDMEESSESGRAKEGPGSVATVQDAADQAQEVTARRAVLSAFSSTGQACLRVAGL
jgi:tRNA threonylcarbamoyladenosine biosynthesis protein TsaE